MKVAFRADAGPLLGSGHVMRCLTLARELARQSHDCEFVCREQPGDLIRLTGQEFPVRILPAVDPTGYQPSAMDTPHAAWAGLDQVTDAQQTAELVGSTDWLVVDHYAFDARWDKVARRCAARLMVLDDLANRPHDCDLLLDQSLGRRAADYAGLLPFGARLLLGPSHVLLRPEFAQNRAESLRARANRPARQVLIAMGGLDADNSISAILTAVASLPQAAQFEVSVVISSRAPHLGALRAQAARMPFPTRLLIDETNMAGVMSGSDLAISASGLTAYELACMGVPMLLLPVSDIQARVARELEGCVHALSVPDWQHDRVGRISSALANFLDELSNDGSARRRLSTVFDGHGPLRVVAAMSGQAYE